MRLFYILITTIVFQWLVYCGRADIATNNTLAAPETKAPSEVDVAVSILGNLYKDTIQSKVPLVIESELSSGMLPEPTKKSLLAEASKEIPKDLILDYCDKNSKPQLVWTNLPNKLRVIFITKDEQKSLFSSEPGHKPDGWDKFYTKYPKSPGIITISRVGFNKAGDMAMIYIGNQYHWLAGHGGIQIFRKQNGKWVWLTGIGGQWVS